LGAVEPTLELPIRHVQLQKRRIGLAFRKLPSSTDKLCPKCLRHLPMALGDKRPQ